MLGCWKIIRQSLEENKTWFLLNPCARWCDNSLSRDVLRDSPVTFSAIVSIEVFISTRVTVLHWLIEQWNFIRNCLSRIKVLQHRTFIQILFDKNNSQFKKFKVSKYWAMRRYCYHQTEIRNLKFSVLILDNQIIKSRSCYMWCKFD